MKALIENQLQLEQQDTIVFLGDYIDRGPDSKAVIDYLIQFKETHKNVVFLRGNHEQMFLEAQLSMHAHNRWIDSGGEEVMQSYGLRNFDPVPYQFQDFISNTHYYYIEGEYIFVHAGLNHLAKSPLNDFNAMMWIREFEVTKKLTGGKILIHGHTPTSMQVIEDQIKTSATGLKICLDNGCVYKGKRAEMGNLLAFEVYSKTLFIQHNIDF